MALPRTNLPLGGTHWPLPLGRSQGAEKDKPDKSTSSKQRQTQSTYATITEVRTKLRPPLRKVNFYFRPIQTRPLTQRRTQACYLKTKGFPRCPFLIWSSLLNLLSSFFLRAGNTQTEFNRIQRGSGPANSPKKN